MKLLRFVLLFGAVLALAWATRPAPTAAAIYAMETIVAASGLDEGLEAIGYNSHRGEFLVIWQVRNGANSDLYGRRAVMTPAFAWLGQAFVIANSSRAERNAAVAYNSNDGDFLVVYEYEWNVTDVDLRGQRVAGWAGGGDSGPSLDLKGGPFGIAESLSIERSPDVAHFHAGQNFLVVYTVENATESDVFARRVARRGLGDGGGELIGSVFPIAADFQRSEKEPVVITVGQQGYFLAAYAYAFGSGDFDILGQRVHGTPQAGSQLLNPAFDIAFSETSETEPDLAYSPSRQAILAAWTSSSGGDSDVWGAWLDERILSGSALIGASFTLAADPVAVERGVVVDVDPTRADSAPAALLTRQANAGAGERLGVLWLDPNPLAGVRILEPLYLFPERPFTFQQPVLKVCHGKPGMLAGYSARFGVSPNTQDDAHLLPTTRWNVLLPLIRRGS